jgi:hypothetical protein
MIYLKFRGRGPKETEDPSKKQKHIAPLPGFDSYIYQLIGIYVGIPSIICMI